MKNKPKKLHSWLLKTELIFLLLSVTQMISAQNAGPTLDEGFKSPPESAKPTTWDIICMPEVMEHYLQIMRYLSIL